MTGPVAERAEITPSGRDAGEIPGWSERLQGRQRSRDAVRLSQVPPDEPERRVDDEVGFLTERCGGLDQCVPPRLQ